MTEKMTSFERFSRMYAHRPADRIPVIDAPWGATIERWHTEGLPTNVSFVDYFDLDRIAHIGVDNSPQYPEHIVEQTDEYVINTTRWGATLKNWKHIASTPEFIDFKIDGPDAWQKAKSRMTPSRDRIPWKMLQENHAQWRQEGYWIEAGLWFGFDVTHSWTVGTERLLMALLTDPEWCMDMFNHFLDIDIALLDQVWDAGYTFDAVSWPDDMGYKQNQFFSVRTYRHLLKPVHKRAVDWAHAKGVKVRLHSCGDVNPFIPDLVEIGIDALNPLEVKAGMDPCRLKVQFGDDLVLHGGINAVYWDDKDRIEAEMRRVIPILKAHGGYIFSSDHSVPSSVSLENFRNITTLAKELGSY
ncbi:MAG: uroporphyrinogen decarboxylase family protein [Anaerolineae bacterium]|nr:uroporphyrinogen decarboxylase family protein [Anaerolineae bacterium]